MEQLIKLVKTYRLSSGLAERLRLAEAIFHLIEPDWEIDIFDSNGNYVQSLSGDATNGVIEAYWDMIDTNGVARTNAVDDPDFSATISVGSVTKTTPPKVAVVPYPVHGEWAVAFQDNFYNYANSNMYYNAIYDMGSMGGQYGGATTYWPTGPTNGQTFPIRYSTTNNPVPIGTMLLDIQAFESLIKISNVINLYYCGHGTDNSLAGYISADVIQYGVLQNLSNKQPSHYYRFVFLDGCETANGSLPAAFGINLNSPLPLSYFQRHGIRPRAFLGNNRTVYWSYPGAYQQNGITYDGFIPTSVPYFLTNLEFYWGQYGYDITTALYYAFVQTPYIAPGWDTGQYIQVFGYDGLHVDDYNWQSDWSN